MYTHVWPLGLLNNETWNAGTVDMQRAYGKENTQRHVVGTGCLNAWATGLLLTPQSDVEETMSHLSNKDRLMVSLLL